MFHRVRCGHVGDIGRDEKEGGGEHTSIVFSVKMRMHLTKQCRMVYAVDVDI